MSARAARTKRRAAAAPIVGPNRRVCAAGARACIRENKYCRRACASREVDRHAYAYLAYSAYSAYSAYLAYSDCSDCSDCSGGAASRP
ncbi:hypothetical protein Y024_4688 [Burkholderia pseudomallei TSV44]|uniref:hypothetical protein n=1 Tax=Burkholderia pseudomallei TaxID=28450 RepID=UPI000536A5C8|nr:hypothetical protein [Burkholderia pseudomallei]KGX55996.1 hypothetical protein Y024_4688 [Burkholderia pseudomallei TSV44]